MARNAAFEVLYREYYARVHGLCRRLLGTGDLAEDAVQETFMRAYRNFRKYDPSLPFWQWIAAIANNYCIDLLRKKTKTQALFGEESVEAESIVDADGSQPVAEVIAAQDADRLQAAVLDLPPKYRVPVVLAYFSQLSYDEIAEQLNISRNHVGVLLLRAKQQLRGALSDPAGEESGGQA